MATKFPTMTRQFADLRHFKSILAGFSFVIITLFILFNVDAISSFKTKPSPSSSSSSADTIATSSVSVSDPCGQLPRAEDVLVVVKTGATALRERLPVHLQTTLRCIPHYVIFSDMEEEFKGYHIHDVLSGVAAQMKQTAPEFQFYRQLHENRDRVVEFMEENPSFRRDAWDLDKWKFLPVVERALQSKPDAKWYMFIEADTFLVWSNLLQWLSQLDSRKPYFLGLPVILKGQDFAYGGAGWLMSRAAVQQTVHHMSFRKEEYEDFTNKTSYGDLILGYTLEQASVRLTGAWPLIQRETPSTMEYTKDVWCSPVVTFHHIDATDIKAIWDFEQEWIARVQTPLLHFDIFKRLVDPLLAPRIDGWDNFSNDEEETLTSDQGFEDCKYLCETDVQCMQFRFAPKKCILSHSIILGWKADPSVISISGWMMDRITQLKERIQCEGGTWISVD